MLQPLKDAENSIQSKVLMLHVHCGLFTYIQVICGVNLGTYSIHAASGYIISSSGATKTCNVKFILVINPELINTHIPKKPGNTALGWSLPINKHVRPPY